MRRIAMCEQASTGLRMMREEWQKSGHPAPTYKNDRAWKAFELFIPELDKEVDMASDLIKAVFGDAKQVTGEVTGEVCKLLKMLAEHPLTRSEAQAALKLKGQVNFRDRYMGPALEAGLVEMTIPDKPRSSKQKYRLTEKGRRLLAQTPKDGT